MANHQQDKINGMFLVIERKNDRGLRHWADELQRRHIPAVILADEYTLDNHLDLLKDIAGAGFEIGLVYNEQQSGMMRCFETAAMGCVVLSNPVLDYRLLSPDGFVIYPQETPHIAAEYAKQILSDPERAKQWIADSMQWVRPHTWDARAQTVVAWWTDNEERVRDTNRV